jgi:hypothetical protein
MSPTPRRTARLSVGSVVVAVAAAFVAAGVGGADAASLGGITAKALTAATVAGASGAPTVQAWENFDGTNGTNLSGTTTDGGAKTWLAIRGTWTISSNRAISTSADSALVLNSAAADQKMEVTVYRATSAWDAGLIANSNVGGSQFLTAEWTSGASGSIELWKYNGGWTSLGSVTNLYPGGLATAPASITLRVVAVGATLTAYVNGVSTVSATLSAADQTTFKNVTHAYTGIYAYLDALSNVDNAHLDA